MTTTHAAQGTAQDTLLDTATLAGTTTRTTDASGAGLRPTPVPLVVGAADDHAETRADELADRIVRRLSAGSGTAPEHAAPEHEQDGAETHSHGAGCGHLRRSSGPALPGAVVGHAGGALDAGTTAQIESRRGQGRALPTTLRRSFEGALGTSLGHVRVHDDATAVALNRRMSAQAFATGNDIFLGDVATDTAEGTRVLAHEVAHVVTEGDGGRVQRAFWNRTDAEKQERADKKAAKKAQKEQEQQQKLLAQQHKALEKAKAAEYQTARAEGTAGRQAMADGVHSADGAGTPEGRLKALNARFAEALRAEQDAVAALTAAEPTRSAEDIADDAYATVWLGTEYADLKHVRPARETAAERLVRDVRVARQAAQVRTQFTKDSERGSMLTPALEAAYEAYVLAYDAYLEANPDASEIAAQAAGESAWAAVPAKLRKKRPERDSAVDRAAIKQARARLVLRVDDIEAPDLADQAESFSDTSDEITGGLENVTTVANVFDPAEKFGTQLKAAATGPVGELEEAISKVKERKAKGWRKDSDVVEEDPTTMANVTTGINAVAGIFSGLKDGVTNAIKLARTISDMHESGTERTRDILAGIKAASDGVKGVTSSAKSAAELAEVISPAVADSVAKVVPGLNIVIAVTEVVSNVTDLAGAAMRFHDANETIFTSRVRGAGAGKIDLLVYPMMKLVTSFTKNLCGTSWATSKSVADLATSIATVATAGGFGIPAAVQGGVAVADKLYQLGDFIHTEVYRAVARTAEADSAVRHLEGAAEDELSKHPVMAVDGIIMRAVQGDAHAAAYLATFQVDGAAVDDVMLGHIAPPVPGQAPAQHEDMLFKIREAVLEEMGDSGNPESQFTTWKRKVGDTIDSVRGKWADTGTMASRKNRMDAASTGTEKNTRGTLWRLRQMFRFEDTHARNVKQTDVRWEDATGGVDGEGAFVVCGNAVLPPVPTAAEQQQFAAELDRMTTEQILEAMRNPLNDATANEFLLQVCSDRWKKEDQTSGK